EGNHVLVNGREHPRLVARAGAPQRWRIVNAAKSRFLELGIGEATFTTIGVDGGLQERPQVSNTIALGPGERVDAIVTPPGKPGTETTLRGFLFNRGYGSVETRLPFEELLQVAIADLPPLQAPPLPQIHREIEPLNPSGATPVNLDLT